MIQIILPNGETFEVEWIGVSTIDGVLRFNVINADMTAVLQTFMKPENCSPLVRKFDEDEKTFEGYTVFRGIIVNYDNSMIVSLSKI